MIEEKGRVVNIDADGIWVETNRQNACSGCSANHGCGHKLFASLGQQNKTSFCVNNPKHLLVKLNDEVRVGIEEGAFLRATIFIYSIPLIMLLVGVFSANFLELTESLTILLSFVSFFIGLILVRYGSHRWFSAGCYQPILTAVF